MEFSALKSNFVSAFLCWSSRAHTHTHSSKRVYSSNTKNTRVPRVLVYMCMCKHEFVHSQECMFASMRTRAFEHVFTHTHVWHTQHTNATHLTHTHLHSSIPQVEEFFLLDRLVFKMASLRPTVGAFAITGAILCDIVVKYMDTIKSRTGMLSAITGHLFFSTAWQWSDTPSMPAYLIYPIDFTQKVHVITTLTSMHSLSLSHWFLLLQNVGIFSPCLSFVRVVYTCFKSAATAMRCNRDCNTLQRTAFHCNGPQHTVTRCNTLQHDTEIPTQAQLIGKMAAERAIKAGKEIYVKVSTCSVFLYIFTCSARVYTNLSFPS